MEIWRPCRRIPEYLVSSYGNLMRLPFEGQMPHGGKRWYGGVSVSGAMCEKGRRHIVWRNKTHRIHQLVCEAFHGPKPFPKAVVMHINDDPSDNRAENLRWGTQKENLNTPKFIAYCKARTGVNSPTIKHKLRRAA